MKKLLTILALIIPMMVNAQEHVRFILNENGEYRTKDGEDYVVVPFEGKTAKEIYNEIVSNVFSFYNDPNEVMSGLDGVSIKIRAISNKIVYAHPTLMGRKRHSGYYQLEFKIKDGRVRVSAPHVEDKVWWVNHNNCREYSSFRKAVGSHFKNGELKKKRADQYNVVVAEMNNTINTLLILSAAQEILEEDPYEPLTEQDSDVNTPTTPTTAENDSTSVVSSTSISFDNNYEELIRLRTEVEYLKLLLQEKERTIQILTK